MVCFSHVDFEMCFAPQGRAIVHLSSPHFFADLHLHSSDSFSSLIFFLLLFSSVFLPTSVFSSVDVVGSLTSKFPSTIYYSYYILIALVKTGTHHSPRDCPSYLGRTSPLPPTAGGSGFRVPPSCSVALAATSRMSGRWQHNPC